jgi:hypothetical protein
MQCAVFASQLSTPPFDSASVSASVSASASASASVSASSSASQSQSQSQVQYPAQVLHQHNPVRASKGQFPILQKGATAEVLAEGLSELSALQQR